MINALGLLEVSGLTASIEAADAMLKAAQVRLVSQTVTPPGLITLVITGDLAACRAALDAGSAAASRLGTVIARKEIGRPDDDTEWFVLNLKEAQAPSVTTKVPAKKPSKAKQPTTNAQPTVKTTEATIIKKEAIATVSTADQAAVEIDEDALLELIAKHPQGLNVTDIISYFNASRAEIKTMLQDGISNGILRRRGNRYYLIEAIK